MTPALYILRLRLSMDDPDSPLKSLNWQWAVTGSNRRPSRCKRDAQTGGAWGAVFTMARNGAVLGGSVGCACLREACHG